MGGAGRRFGSFGKRSPIKDAILWANLHVTKATSEVTFILSAECDGVVRDLWRLVRRPSEFRSIRLDTPELNMTYRDGHRPYLKGELGLSKWLHPELITGRRRLTPVKKHFEVGWPRRWGDILDVQPTTGTHMIGADELQTYPLMKAKADEVILPLQARRPLFYPSDQEAAFYRATVPLSSGAAVQADVFLARASRAVEESLSRMAETGVCLWVWTAWPFWSAVHVRIDRLSANAVAPNR